MWRQSTSIKPPPWRDGKMFFQQFNTTLCFLWSFSAAASRIPLKYADKSYFSLHIGMCQWDLLCFFQSELLINGKSAVLWCRRWNVTEYIFSSCHIVHLHFAVRQRETLWFSLQLHLSHSSFLQVTSKIKIYNNFIDDQLVNTSWFQPLKWVFFQYFNNFTIFCNIVDVWTVGRTKQTLWLCYFGLCHHICHHFDERWHHSRINWFPQTSLVSSHIWYWPRERRNNFKNHSLI